MPRPKGSLNVKGKQSEEERKINKRASSQPPSIEARQREYAKRKVSRRENKITTLNDRIRLQRQDLHAIGKFSGINDPALKELQSLLGSDNVSKLQFLEEHASIKIGDDADESHINRMLMFTHHCKLTHQAKGRYKTTLPAYIQGEMQKCAMEAESVTKATLQNFFRRLFREEVFSPKKLSIAQDESMCFTYIGKFNPTRERNPSGTLINPKTQLLC